MSWAEVGQIATASIASAGGIGAIIYVAIRFSTNRIAEHLNEKYKAQLTQELEKYKSFLSKKNYMSKSRFDVEFKIYRELTGTFWALVKIVSQIIPAGKIHLSNEMSKDELWKKWNSDAFEAFVAAQDALNESMAFIPEKFTTQFEGILAIARFQIVQAAQFSVPWDTALQECVPKTKELQKCMRELNSSIREYLESLDVE